MNVSLQYEKPLLLLFSDFNIDMLDALLSENNDIVLRKKRQIRQVEDPLLLGYSRSWNIQYHVIELDLFWLEGTINISAHKQIFCNISASMFASAIAVDLGKNVEGGRKNTAIMLSFFKFIRTFISVSKPIGSIWNVSKILTDPQYLSDIIAEYEKGGAFPILPLINFINDQNGAIYSQGLSYFSDQEIIYDAGHLPVFDVITRMTRMVHDIAVNGAYVGGMTFDGMETDEQIILNIDANGSIVQASSRFGNV